MGFKEISSLDADTTTALGGFNKKTGKSNPTKAEGYFLGSKVVDSAKSKTGTAKLHILQTPKGNVGVWGKTDLDRKMLAVAPGTMIRITQNGTVPTKGGNDMYKFKVEVDTENTIEVATGQEDGEEAGQAEDSPAEEEYDPFADENLDEEALAADEIPHSRPTPPARPAAAPDAARQQKVKDLLARKTGAKVA